MCGITGIIGHNFSESHLKSANDALRHRGPDGQGNFVDKNAKVGFGHCRLSIIDLQTGDQPLYDQSGNIVLVCNGEIYDFERIREKLQDKGYHFSTKSDSEVIINLYLEYGLKFVEHLRGEFAFLLFDRIKNIVLAVRDRFGIKPLFFNRDNNNFLFSSEAKGIFATGLLMPRIDITAIRDNLSFVIPQSIFQGIETVPPGSIMKIDLDGACETITYWDVDLPTAAATNDTAPFEQHITDVQTHFDEAIRLRLRADVPVGVYLSGGIDSAAVAATISRHHNGQLKAFTVSFPEDSAFDEHEVAREMAEKIGAEFHSITCDHEAQLKNIEACLWHTEAPFVNFHGIGKFMLSELASKHVKVVLTGEGADEIFLGYDYFQPGKRSISHQLGNKKEKSQAIKGPHVEAIVNAIGFVPQKEIAEGLSMRHQQQVHKYLNTQHHPLIDLSEPLQRLKDMIRKDQTANRTTARKIQYYSIKGILAGYILSILGDRQEMAHSLEGRTPFLDHHLFQAVREIPDHFKIHKGKEKYILREAIKDRITETVYKRKKQAFSAPPMWIKKGIHPQLDALLERYLSADAIKKSGIFNFRSVALVRRIHKLLFFDCNLKRRLNSLLAYTLTVQILERLYVQDFKNSLILNNLNKQ